MNYIIPSFPKSQKSAGGKYILVILFIILFSVLKSATLFGQQVSSVTTAGTKFLIYTPPGYNPAGTTSYPLLVVLHGGSEIGDDLTKLTTSSNQLPARLIQLNQWNQTLPFIVVSPQLKRDVSIPNVNNQEWPATYVNEVVDFVKSKYKTDIYKYYFTGVSLGGAGVWDYAAAYPTKVAAIIPISGKTRLENACLVKNIPIWVFHGESDGLVKPQFSVDMVNAINACAPLGKFKPQLNLLFARGHEGWNEIFNGTSEYRIYDWLLKFRRNSTANKLPYVNAGFDHKVLLRSQPINLIGDYFDSDGTITAVKWTQTSGALLTMSNTTTRFLTLTNLKAGVFEFQLQVTDNLGGKSIDKVKLEIVSTSTAPIVTAMVLMNGKTNTDIGNLSEGQVINKTTLGITEINIRAIAGTGTGSVRFRINSDQNTRTINAAGPYLITKQISPPEWQIKNGEYLICATPYPQTAGRGVPGTTLCYKITVTSSGATARISEASVWQEGELLRSSSVEGNQWILNDKEIDGATAETYEPLVKGEYYVRINKNNSLVHSNKIVVDKISDVKIVVLYPNPISSGYLHIDNLDREVATQFIIMNTNGMEVQRGELNGDSAIEIANDLNKGIYRLLLKNGKGQRAINFMVD